MPGPGSALSETVTATPTGISSEDPEISGQILNSGTVVDPVDGTTVGRDARVLGAAGADPRSDDAAHVRKMHSVDHGHHRLRSGEVRCDAGRQTHLSRKQFAVSVSDRFEPDG